MPKITCKIQKQTWGQIKLFVFMVFMMLLYVFNRAPNSTWLTSPNFHYHKLNILHVVIFIYDSEINRSHCITHAQIKQTFCFFFPTKFSTTKLSSRA